MASFYVEKNDGKKNEFIYQLFTIFCRTFILCTGCMFPLQSVIINKQAYKTEREQKRSPDRWLQQQRESLMKKSSAMLCLIVCCRFFCFRQVNRSALSGIAPWTVRVDNFPSAYKIKYDKIMRHPLYVWKQPSSLRTMFRTSCRACINIIAYAVAAKMF